MAGIGTTLAIYDQMTAPLQKIRSSMESTISSFEKLQNSADNTFDSSEYDKVANDLKKLSGDIKHAEQTQYGLNSAMGDMPTELPVIPQPEPIKITWNVEEIDVFRNSGIERFQSEIDSTRGYLDRLNDSQVQIGRTAAGLDIIPDDAYMDIKNMITRIGDIRSEIELLEANPMNLNVDQVNNQLETLRKSLSTAEVQQQGLNDAMARMDPGDIQSTYNNLNKTISDSERHIRDNVGEQQRFTKEVEQTNQKANVLSGTFMKMIGIIGAAFSIKQVIGLSDTMTNITSRLNLMNDGLQTTVELNDMIFQSSQRSRGSYLDTADAVAKLGGNAKDAFNNTAEIVRFSELLNKQFTIAGTEQSGVAAATLQLTQAMGMGALRGEELNSVLEQAPNIVQTIADYMDVPIGKIKEMASEGEITSNIIKAAMFSAADDINAKFESMPMTFAQIWTSFKNQALMSFQPVLQRLNDIANSHAFQSFVNNAIQWVAILAHVVTIAFEGMGNMIQWVTDHWDLLAPAIWGVIAALVVYNSIKGIGWLLTLKDIAAKIWHTAVSWAQTAAIIAMAFAQGGLNAVVALGYAAWMVYALAIIAVIAVFYIVIAVINHFTGLSISATGLIAGAMMWLGTFILNVFIMIINAGIVVVNLLVNAFHLGIWAIEVAIYALGLAFVLVLDAILNFGILIINTFVNAWKLGVYGVQMVFIGLGEIVAMILDGILNFGLSVAEGFANGWNSAVYGLQMAFYHFQSFTSKILKAVGQGSIGVVNSVLSGISSLINAAVGGLNKLIGMANNIPGVNISTVGTVDFKVGSSAQSAIDSLGSGITAPVRAEAVSLGRTSLASSYRNSVNIPDAPDKSNVIDYQNNTGQYLSSVPFPDLPKFEQTFDTLDFKDMGAAFDKGYEWGENLENTIKDFSLKDALAGLLGMDDFGMDDIMGGMEGMGDIPGIDELLGDKADKATGGSDKAGKDLGKIADNTDDIADDLGITKDDLKYMRDLASRDFVNRFTNNHINFEVKNDMNVNNEMDLDGVIDYVTSGLEQAVEVTVEGVYP